MIKKIVITRPDDWHVHLRDNEIMDSVIFDTVKQFSRAIIMPNLQIPITSTDLAKDYRSRILKSLDRLRKTHKINDIDSFIPMMTIYLTDNTNVQEVIKAYSSGFVFAFKFYPATATTNSHMGVLNILGNCHKVLEKMQELGMPLLVHGEVTDKNVDIFDREAVFIDKVMIPLRKEFPLLKIVFEHISTKDGVDFVINDNGPTAATVTPQHLLYNRNKIFVGGLNPHFYCLPILKKEKDRRALLSAVTSGSKRFFLGTDSAPHVRLLKESSCGCAGCYSSYNAMSLYADIFDSNNSLDKLENFASFNGPDFYGLPRNKGTLTIYKKNNLIPDCLSFNDIQIVPLGAGSEINWSI